MYPSDKRFRRSIDCLLILSYSTINTCVSYFFSPSKRLIPRDLIIACPWDVICFSWQAGVIKISLLQGYEFQLRKYTSPYPLRLQLQARQHVSDKILLIKICSFHVTLSEPDKAQLKIRLAVSFRSIHCKMLPSLLIHPVVNAVWVFYKTFDIDFWRKNTQNASLPLA